MMFGSVCSGIEAASVAWDPIGWSAAWFAEIEPFPAAVLAHHWPWVENLGDMTKIADMVRTKKVIAPDVLVGGTPCQAFSVAGLRGGLSDGRGQLTLEFVRLANAIDEQRKQPAIIVWENVPGVLSSADNAFGCFLAGLAGEDQPLVAPGKKWANAGCVFGPQRTVAWRILDAQYFGVAQRRRRVFVVASAREGFDPTAVLFESDGVRRDLAPSRGRGEETAALTGSSAAIGSPEFDESGLQRVVGTLCADTHPGAYSGQDAYTGRLVPAVYAPTVSPCLETQAGSYRPPCTQAYVVTPPLTASMDKPLGNGGKDAFVAIAHRDVMPTMVSGGSTEASHNQMPGQFREEYLAPTSNMQVRRLTPTECERLQGFPDGHTAIPVKGKPAADGPRYKALGNSMAVPVMRWIGLRISQANTLNK